MGITSELRTYLHKHEATGGAWLTNGYRRSASSSSGLDAVVQPVPPRSVEIIDVLTDMHFMRNSRREYEPVYTGLEFYEEVCKQLESAFAHRRVSVYVVCMDHQLHVPHQKHAEQKKRAHSRQANYEKKVQAAGDRKAVADTRPYPRGTQIGPRGIRLPFAAVDDDDDDDDGGGGGSRKARGNRAWEPFHLQRVLGNRHLRAKLWMYVLAQLAADPFLPVPQHGTVLFDIDGRVLGLSPRWHEGTRVMEIKHPLLKHRLGESDLKMIFWAQVFERRPVVLHSTDQDTIPIALQYLKHLKEPRRRPLYWRYRGWKRTQKGTASLFTVVNMSKLLDCVHDRLKWNTEELMLASILCGTDFWDKSNLLHGVGISYILYGVQQSRPVIERLFRALLRQYKVDAVNTSVSMRPVRKSVEDVLSEALEFVIRRIYHVRISKTKIADFETISDRALLTAERRETEPPPPTLQQLRVLTSNRWKRMSVPSAEDVSRYTALLRWHIEYWFAFDPVLKHARELRVIGSRI